MTVPADQGVQRAAPLSYDERMQAVACGLADDGYWVNHGRGAGIYPVHHHHAGFELHWVEQGVGQILTGDAPLLFGAGDLVLVHGAMEHSLRLYSSLFVRTLAYFAPDMVDRPSLSHFRTLGVARERGVVRARPLYTAQARLNNIVGAMLGELGRQAPAAATAVAAYLQLILVEVERMPPGEAHALHRFTTAGSTAVRDALAYIENHMEHAVTVEEMARDLAISPRHLERCFKETVGTSIKAFWTDRRMEHAARLLRQPGVAVTDVAVRVGYASPFAFSRTFKRRFGVAPSHAAGTSAVDPAALPSP